MQFDLDKINQKFLKDISKEEWQFINSLDFDVLFEDKQTYTTFELFSIIEGILLDVAYTIPIRLNLVNFSDTRTITDRGWSLIKWAVHNRFNDVCKVVDQLLESLDERNFEKKNRILNVFSLIPINNYGIMISLSKDPSKLFQFMDIFSKVRS